MLKSARNWGITHRWEDDDNNDGYRPESVQVQLYSMVGDEEAKPYGEVVTLEDTDNEDTKWKMGKYGAALWSIWN